MTRIDRCTSVSVCSDCGAHRSRDGAITAMFCMLCPLANGGPIIRVIKRV
jgi:hypothetical protein